MTGFTVDRIPFSECKEWLLYKHYAHRIPSISYAFGLFENGILKGVCTFGSPPRVMNNGESIFNNYLVETLELNRLIVESDKKNITSFFVSQCLKKLHSPLCIISYADFTFGHNGYIYQSCNFVYTGLNQIHERQIFYNGIEVHPRTACSKGFTNISEWAKNDKNVKLGEYTKKHRYIYFIGSKRQKKQMLKALKYKIEPYPKGENKRYDASYQPTIQGVLF